MLDDSALVATIRMIASGSAQNLCLYDATGSVYNYMIIQDLPTLTVYAR